MSEIQPPGNTPLQAACDFEIVFVRLGSEPVVGRMTEINRNGAHISIAVAGEENQVVRLRLVFDVDRPINFLGRILRVVSDEEASEDRPAGMSVTIFAMEKEDRERWAFLLERAVEKHGNLIETAGSAAGDDLETEELVAPQKVSKASHERRRFERYRATLAIRLGGMSSLFEMYSRDISAGGAFIQMAKPLEEGSLLHLTIVHPITAAVFALDGKVVRTEETGVGVVFLHMDDQARKMFMRFIVSGQPPS